jgi:hypothetical protein
LPRTQCGILTGGVCTFASPACLISAADHSIALLKRCRSAQTISDSIAEVLQSVHVVIVR